MFAYTTRQPVSLPGDALQNEARNLTDNACGQGHKTLVILLEKLFIHPWLVVKAIKVRFGGELD